MNKLNYLAYGSNLHPVRLLERVKSIKLLYTVKLAGYHLAFHKRGQDKSGKCDLIYTGMKNDIAYGVIYSLCSEDKKILDQIEGRGYQSKKVTLKIKQQFLTCQTYTAKKSHIDTTIKPFHWYKQLVLQGARFHTFPDEYIMQIDAIQTISDPNRKRQNINNLLINSMLESHNG